MAGKLTRSERMRRSQKQRSRRAWIVTGAVASVLFIVSAIVFSVAAGTQRITAHAQALHLVDDALLVSTAARAHVGFATQFAQIEEQLRVATSEQQTDALDQARAAIEDLAVGIAELENNGQVSEDLLAAHADYVATAATVVDLLEQGDLTAAQTTAAERLDPAYVAFTELLQGEQLLQRKEVFAADSRVAWMGDLARLLVALLIPLAVIVVYREVVRRQQRQKELELRLDAERTVSKARDDFVANASHEFRTPLTSIYGLAQILEDDPEIAEHGREMAHMISTEAADLSRMVEDLLTTARLEAGALVFHPEQVMTHEDIDEIVRPFQSSGVAVDVHVQPAVVRVDRLRQRQVLRNLLSNARKYGGPTLKITGARNGQWYEWIVADDGDGIPAELEAKLFQRFMHQGTNVSVPGGVGLGLSIVKALAEGMGGTVFYERANRWTQFVVRVPLATPSAASQPAPAGTPASRAGFEVAASSPYQGAERRGGG